MPRHEKIVAKALLCIPLTCFELQVGIDYSGSSFTFWCFLTTEARSFFTVSRIYSPRKSLRDVIHLPENTSASQPLLPGEFRLHLTPPHIDPAVEFSRFSSASMEIESYLDIVSPSPSPTTGATRWIGGRVPLLLAIYPDDPSVASYQLVEEQLARTVFSALGAECELLSLFRLGSRRSASSPAVVVLIRPGVRHKWQQLKMTMDQILNSSAISSGERLRVRFFVGGCKSYGGERALSIENEIDPRPVPKMGSSIGRKHSEGEVAGAGTLGGFFCLQVGDKIHRCAMTCHHVVAACCRSTQQDEESNWHGYSYSDALGINPEVTYPASIDAHKTMLHLQQKIKTKTTHISKSREEEEARLIAGMRSSQGLSRRIAESEILRESYQQKLDKIQHWPSKLGNVLVSSGLACHGQHILDWALIEIRKTENPHFQLNLLPEVPEKMGPETFKKSGSWIEGDRISTLDNLVPGDWYMKLGRTTGITAGLCNGVMAYRPKQCDRLRYDLDGNEVKADEDIHVTHVIVAEQHVLDNGDSAPIGFCCPGDSGSLVLNSAGKVCGMVWGSFTGVGHGGVDWVGAGLVSCMSEIIPSIEAKIGDRVMLRLPDDDDVEYDHENSLGRIE
jgi:hypothetical protein